VADQPPAPSTDSRLPSWWPSWLSPANISGAVVALFVFAVLVAFLDSNLGTLVAAAAGAAAGTAAWWWLRRRSVVDPSVVLGVPALGDIPDFTGRGPLPVLTAPDSEAALAFVAASGRIEALTTGQVLLVSSPTPGRGATTAALNLAVAASRAGRRVLLIDGDVVTRGLSRYSGTGPEPGLTELAGGEAELQQCARLWRLSETSRMPFIPAGRRVTDPVTALQGPGLADAIDRVTERADLIIVDTSPVLWQGANEPLSVHADGTVLAISPGTDRATLERARDICSAGGAPVLGYVVNRRKGGRKRRTATRMAARALALFLALGIGYTVLTSLQIWRSWAAVDRAALTTEQARIDLPQLDVGTSAGGEDFDEETAAAHVAVPVDDDAFQAYLIVGSDLGGLRADVIMITLIPTDGRPPVMLSLPRDLYIPNRCTGGYTRINANLSGCGDQANGPTLLALTIEDYTGIVIDHFALFDFDGFERIIDGVGGIEICVDHPVRDSKSFLDLPAGCTNADGEQALAWVRSRTTEEYINGRWRIMPGVNDLTRNERQQDVVLAMFRKLRGFDSPADLLSKVQSLSDAFTLDDGLGVGDAISLAWGMRSLDISSVNRLDIPVTPFVTKEGAEVLLPAGPFSGVIEEVYADFTTGT
jgi:LCP family protein required for cell wall assembly